MSVEFNENHLKELTEVNERSKSNTHRLDAVEEAVANLRDENKMLYEMSVTIKNLTDGIITIKEDVSAVKKSQEEMKEELTVVKNAPAKNKSQWFDTFAKLVITALVTAIISFTLSAMFPMLF